MARKISGFNLANPKQSDAKPLYFFPNEEVVHIDRPRQTYPPGNSLIDAIINMHPFAGRNLASDPLLRVLLGNPGGLCLDGHWADFDLVC
ncbi:MAG: hypothetical protein M1537_03625 [Nitrospirae bacterium]|nr:hypothetical protein [Nitrospirota bacterium]MCL5285795.1 hypothetical protein [Nitrospirota bacterium]